MTAHDPITVHALAANSPTSQDDAALLDVGRSLVQQARGGTGWRAPRQKFDKAVFLKRGKAYVFARPPPRITTEWTANSPTAKEWGAPVSPSDEYSLDDLEPFQSPFDLPSPHAPVAQSLVPPYTSPKPTTRRRARSPEVSAISEPPRKRVKLDLHPLHSLIPQPHCLPARFRPYKESSKATPYSRTTPTPLSPHTPASLSTLLASSYARVAWVIPVRGAPPWDGASSASILDEPDALPRSPAKEGTDEELDVLWTHRAVLQFWDFLRQSMSAPLLGPVSLSFHAAPASSLPSTFSDSYLYPGQSELAQRGVSAPSGSEVPFVPRKRLLDTDHIKIYCDARRAMVLRNLLDSWAYVHEDGVQEGADSKIATAKKTKARVLKYAKLVLVDGKAAGVLVS
ncbi:hypothetical protein EWM64_g1645 [Hericium alpestre]|uniref:Uncharacterized protein n=1 Tax=Hericium alpestre TaxID=135208 RepID=A0A4Z0A7T4_9AGAM|nr:hypothetical protein EWM64_g1645 [Hericium alpestre]